MQGDIRVGGQSFTCLHDLRLVLVVALRRGYGRSGLGLRQVRVRWGGYIRSDVRAKVGIRAKVGYRLM